MENENTNSTRTSFAVVTITLYEELPRVVVSPFWEVEADEVSVTIIDAVCRHVETLGVGAVETVVRPIAC